MRSAGAGGLLVAAGIIGHATGLKESLVAWLIICGGLALLWGSRS